MTWLNLWDPLHSKIPEPDSGSQVVRSSDPLTSFHHSHNMTFFKLLENTLPTARIRAMLPRKKITPKLGELLPDSGGPKLSYENPDNPFLAPDENGRHAQGDVDWRLRTDIFDTSGTFFGRANELNQGAREVIGPSIFSAIWRNRLLVCACVIFAAVISATYPVAKHPLYEATATIAMVQPQPNAALGEVADPTSAQYLDSQVVLLSSGEVAQKAAAIGNSALHRTAFTASDFSGPNARLSITTNTVTDPNSTVVDVGYSAVGASEAQEGANAVLLAYNAVLDQQIKQTVASAVAFIDQSLATVNDQIGALPTKNGPLNAQLETSLITQRSALMNQRAQALIDEGVSLSQSPPMTLAFLPRNKLISKIAKLAGLGGMIGLLLGAALAYVREIRRTRATLTSSQQVEFPEPSLRSATRPLGRSVSRKQTP